MMKPDKDQEALIQRMVNEPTRAFLNGSDMGTGKTLMGVELVKRLSAKTVLVIAPINTHLGWEKAFQGQEVDLPFKIINSTAAGKSAMSEYQWGEEGIYIIGPELFARLAIGREAVTTGRGKNKVPVLDKNNKPKFKRTYTGVWDVVPDVCIFDEVHRAQNRDSITFRALSFQHAGYKLAMSGTPTGNKFSGAWAVTKWLWPDWVEDSFAFWVKLFCETKYTPFSATPEIVGEKNPGEYFASLPGYGRLESDIAKPELVEVLVELPPKQRRVYNQLRDNMVAWIGDNPLVVDAPIALRNRLRSVTLGIPTVSYDEPEVPGGKPLMNLDFELDAESVKMKRAFGVLEEDFEGEPALIGTDSQKFIKSIVHQIDAKYGEGSAREWSGQRTKKQRAADKADYLAGKFKYLVATIPSMAEGVDELQNVSRNVLVLSLSDRRDLMEQFLRRLARRGQKRIVRARYIAAVDTYDLGQIDKQIEDAIRHNKSILAKQKTLDKAAKAG